jgi:geranylgeranyl diphosphate synthase type I
MRDEVLSVRLSDFSRSLLPLVESEMRTLLSGPGQDVSRHYGMMQYHMGWLDESLSPVEASTGKRIRPLLCLLACGAAGGAPENAAPAAAGLELLHNFSLIHDDIEDDSPTRRHRPTVWKLFGVPLACNAGDGMFSLAHRAFYGLERRGLSAAVVVSAMRVFDETCVTLTEGQYLDMSFEACDHVSVPEYFGMIAAKTGALLAASTEIGALVASARTETVSNYRRFGAALGRAFQLRDDILGIWGDEAQTGKSAASDILSKKKSLPVLHAISDAVVGPELANLYSGGPLKASDVPLILSLLDRAGARAFVEAEVHKATDEAQRALNAVSPESDSSYLAALGELLDILADRTS